MHLTISDVHVRDLVLGFLSLVELTLLRIQTQTIIEETNDRKEGMKMEKCTGTKYGANRYTMS